MLLVRLGHEHIGPAKTTRNDPLQMHATAARRPLIMFGIVNQSAKCWPCLPTFHPRSETSSPWLESDSRSGLE